VPEGIVPELLIALAFVAIVAAVFVLLRRRPPEGKGPSTRADVEAISRVEGVTVEVPRERDEAPPATVVEAAPASLRERLAKSRRFLSERLADVLGRGPDEETWDDLEAVLIQADVGVEAATRITEDLRKKARERKVSEASDLRALLAEELVEMFPSDAERTLHLAPAGVTVWLVVGVNGTGKTTTIGKLARDLRERQRSVAMAAADTFRAAADEQLGVWAERSGAAMVKHKPGADPGAVAFDAYQHARARAIDVLIVDTAGRLHTKIPLMDELAKVRRVIEKEGEVHEVLLVIDATAGQNGLVQAREFADSVGVTGVVLAKLDGTAKGGIALAIENSLGLPIKLVGIGEGIDDLEPFDPKSYVDALLS
jgi:fused signal recognition particle receptor